MTLNKPRKIILITIDTLRADRLGCYGYERPTSPNLDRLADEGQVYKYVFSPCSYTVPVHTSLLTGLYPANHDIGFSQKTGKVDTDGTLLIQEILRDQGYETGAFVSSFVLRKDWGLDQGFDVYDDRMTSSEPNRPHELIRDGRETTDVALEWITNNRSKNLFAWLHYFDVHGPYVPVRGVEGPFRPEDYGDVPKLLEKVRDGLPGGIPEYQLLNVTKGENGEVLDYQRDLRHYLAGYDNGVNIEDMIVGKLIDGLKGIGVYDDSLIIVTADHGEALGEDDVFFFHGLTVTPEQARVPLIIKPSAGSDKLEVCEDPVSTVDIMPTILDWIGFSWDGLGLDGVSLLTQQPGRFILSENEWQRAVIWQNYFLTLEKRVVNDGFSYYFDSHEFCRGTRLFDFKTGKSLDLDLPGIADGLTGYSELLRSVVDPKERRIKDKDWIIAEKNRAISESAETIVRKDVVIAEKDRLIAEKDRIIAEKERAITEVAEALSGCYSRVGELKTELESCYNSKSWRLTYPLRFLSGIIKGVKPRN